MNSNFDKILAVLVFILVGLCVADVAMHIVCLAFYGNTPISDLPAWAAFFLFE